MEKPFSGKEAELVAGKAPVEGGAGSKLGCSEPAVGKRLGIHHVHFIAHSGPWDEAKPPNSAPLLGFNLCFLNCKWSFTSGGEEHWEPRVGCLMQDTALKATTSPGKGRILVPKACLHHKQVLKRMVLQGVWQNCQM